MKLFPTVQTAVIGLSLSLVASGEARAAYTFTRIADNSGRFSSFDFPSINNRGRVAFRAQLDAGGEGIFTGSGGQIATIATSSNFPSSSSPVVFSVPSINYNGRVAFTAERQRLEGNAFIGLYTGAGGSLTTITNSRSPYSSFGFAPINGAGKVAFNGRRSSVGNGIFTGSGGSITTIASSSGRYANFSALSINNSGRVAFAASLDDTSSGIFSAVGSSITTIANTKGAFRYVIGASINEEGAVASRAGLQDQRSERIVIIRRGTTTTVAQSNILSTSSFVIFNNVPSINNLRKVAFEAYLRGGRKGIFTGPNLTSNKVIATGDSLFGSRVTDVGLFQEGLNDAGQVAFRARLTSGAQVIVRANPTAL